MDETAALVNSWGVVNTTHAFLPKLKECSEAHLVNVCVGYVMAMMMKRAGIEVTDT